MRTSRDKHKFPVNNRNFFSTHPNLLREFALHRSPKARILFHSAPMWPFSTLRPLNKMKRLPPFSASYHPEKRRKSGLFARWCFPLFFDDHRVQFTCTWSHVIWTRPVSPKKIYAPLSRDRTICSTFTVTTVKQTWRGVQSSLLTSLMKRDQVNQLPTLITSLCPIQWGTFMKRLRPLILKYLEVMAGSSTVPSDSSDFEEKILRLVLQHPTPFWGRFLFRFHVSLRSLTSRAKHGQSLRYKAAVQGPRTPPPFSWRKGASFPPSFPLAKTPVGEELTYLSASPKLFFLRFTSSRPYLAVGFQTSARVGNQLDKMWNVLFWNWHIQ